jgi:predicted transcriptional regulator
MANRTRIEITAQILEKAKEGGIKTRIIYGASLSSNQPKEYLSALIKDGIIKYIREEQKYKTTKKDMEYLMTMDKLNGLTSSVTTATMTATTTKEK